MNNNYFTADLHLYHDNIRKYCNRPFDTVNEMHEVIVDNWNKKVKDGIVWILGDVTFSIKNLELFFKKYKLNGELRLIRGNHEKKIKKADLYKYFKTVDDLKTIKIEEQKIVLCHYAMLVWDCSPYGSWMLCGHSHGRLEEAGKNHKGNKLLDVGVDSFNFTPVSYEEIKEIMKQKEI